MIRKGISGLVLLLFFLGAPGFPQFTPSSETANFISNFKGSILSFSKDELAVSIVNGNPEDAPLSENIKHYAEFLIIVPDHKAFSLVPGSPKTLIYMENHRSDTPPADSEVPPFEEWVAYKDLGIFRSWKLAQLKVMVAKPVSSEDKTVLRLDRLDFRVKFSESGALDSPDSFPLDALANNLFKTMVLNPDCESLYRLRDVPDMAEYEPYIRFVDRVNDSLSSGPVVKLIVYQGGLYGISGQDLQNAGVPLEMLSPNHMVLYHANEQIPLFFQRANRSIFDPGDKLYFYVPPFEGRDYLSYWLLVEKDIESNPPRRIPTEPFTGNQSSAEGMHDIFNANSTVRFYRKVHYNHKLPSPLINGNWYWDEVKRDSFGYYTVDINCVEEKSSEFKFTLHLTGVDAPKTNYCEIFWNQNKIGDCEWEGLKNHTFQTTLPASLLKEGENELVLYAPPRATKKQSASFYLIGFEINYDLKLANDYGPLVFKLKSTPETRASNIWFSQPGSNPLFLMNVTDSANPQILDVMQMINRDKPGYNFVARVNLKPESAFVLGSRGKALSVGKIIPVQSLDLLDKDKNQGGYVIVSHNRFLNALKPFVEFHEKKGNQPVVIDVDKIYDCFNFGDKDHEALKRFFRHRYYFSGGPSLQYGLLVGETSDFIGPPYDIPSDVQEDLVPLYQRGTPITNIVHSDTPYAYVCGDDIIPDFGLGRFPVNTTEELQNLIRKVQNYDTNPPAGEWRNKHVFLTDDEPEFASIAETVMEKFPPYARVFRIFQQNYSYSDLIMLWQRKTSVQARKILLDHIDNGILTLNYFGHGGPNLWSSERIFHISDIQGFTNKDKLFFLTASTCDSSWQDYPEPPVKRSLGELMVLYPEGGAIAVYGPTTGATPSDHQLLMQNFYQAIFDKGVRNFSEAIIYSKIMFFSSRVNSRLLDQFILLGDPAGSLNILEPHSTLSADPQYIDILKGGKVLIKGTTSIQPFWGLARVAVQSPDSKLPSVLMKTHVFNGNFQLEYDLPPQSQAGAYCVSVYSDNPYVKTQELGKAYFEAVDPALELSLEFDIPDSGQIVENSKVNVKPRIRNLSPISLDNIQIRLKQGAIVQPILERAISLQPNQEVGFDMAWLAETGVHEMIWEAQIPADSEKRIFREHKFIPVVSSKEFSKVAVDPNEVQVKADPLVNGIKPEFIIPVYNIGSQPFYELRLGVYASDKPVGKPKFIKYLKSGQRAEVVFASEGDFPATMIPFQIKLDAFNQRTQVFDELFSVNKIINIKLNADLVILPDSVNFESEHFRTGETVFINAIVKNQGDVPADNFQVQAFRDKPWDASKILKPFFPGDSQKFNALQPGEEQKVRLRWDFAQQAETLTVFVVANSNRTVREQDFSNNAAQASLQINSHTNLKIDPGKVQFSRHLIKKGDVIDVSFVVENDSDLHAAGFDVSIEQWGINLEPIPCCEPIRVSGLDPHSTILLSAKWHVQPPMNRFRIIVNSTYLIQENLRSDNQVEFSFDNLETLRNLKQIGEVDAYSFKERFISGTPAELEINPLREVYSTDFQESKGYRFDVASQYVVFGAPVATNESDEDRDNQWAMKKIWLASSPFENAPPISLSFPLPPEIKTTMCDVYIYVHTNKDLSGFPASKLRIKLEREVSFKTHDFSTENLPYTTVRYYLGRYDLADRFLDVTIDDVDERYWSVVNHFEVVPLYSRYQSEIIEIPKNVAGASFALTFDADIPQYTRLDCSYRQGFQGSTNDMQWGEWKPIDLNDPEGFHSLESPYIQWQTEFYCWMEKKPILKDARIRFK
jgi:hypothetical protein